MTFTRSKFSSEKGQDTLPLGFAAVFVLAIIFGVGYGVYYMGSRGDSATNEKCLIYSGGSFEDKKFVKIMEPGRTKENIGWGSKQYCYKTDQRSYIGGEREGADAAAVDVVGGSAGETGSNVRLRVNYQMYFKLNLDEDTLRKFHENIGIKTKAHTDGGWREMLRDYIEPQIERSMEAAALEYDWDKLYSDEATRKAYQADVIKRLKTAINEVVGDDYFCGPAYTEGKDCADFTFTVGKPDLVSEDLVAAIESEETAKRQTQAQSEKNATAERKLEVDRQLVELYGPDGALIKAAIESGKVTFYVLPSGQAVPVPAPTP